jgi:TfoX/Sxy family transcriptional regulator of competence genes
MRSIISTFAQATEKKMFGGVCFLVNGNMACGVYGDGLIIRVGKASYDEAMRKPHVRPFDLTHRPMKAWVFVDPPGYADEDALKSWVAIGIDFAASLPPKEK